jgi:glycosyltransferase involved in cell wall biosynthesis
VDDSAPSGVTVVVPVLDEEGAVLTTLDALDGALAPCASPYEIVVVDDGSCDRTPELLAARAGIRVLRHERTCGYGAALKTGIRAARHPWIAVIDADGTYPASDVPRLLEGRGSFELIVGARTGRNAHDSWPRALVKETFRMFAEFITGAAIPDLNSGLRVFRRELAERYFDLLPDRFSFTTTITVAAIADGCGVHFTVIEYLPRVGRSKLRPIGDTLRIGRQLLRLGIRFAPLRTAACVAAVCGVAFALVTAWHAATAAPRSTDVGYLVAGGLALVLGACAEGRLRRRPAPRVAAGGVVPTSDVRRGSAETR